MRRVILESPFGQDPRKMIAYARACLKDSISRGEAPLASHLLYTQPGVLDDDKPSERELGIALGFAYYRFVDAAVVYKDFGISTGMQAGIDFAVDLGLPIEYRSLPMGRNIVLRNAYPGVQNSFPQPLNTAYVKG